MKNKYLQMPFEEVKKEVERLDDKCDEIFHEGMAKDWSWEEMEKVREPYIKELRLAAAAQVLMTPKESLPSDPYDDLDRECQMPIETFINMCKSGYLSSYDGTGVYADKDKVYHCLNASPWAFYHGFIRDDFEYVCWYNK